MLKELGVPEDAVANPFMNLSAVLSPAQKLRLAVGAVLFLPAHFFIVVFSLFMAALVSSIATAGVKASDIGVVRLAAWRRFMLLPLPFFTRGFVFGYGFWRVKTRGRCATFDEAPIIVSNHIGFLEASFMVSAVHVRGSRG